MKNKGFTSGIFLLIGIFICINLKAQVGCPTDPQFYTKQNQVDSFHIKYPACTTLHMKVTLAGPDITNLSGFRNVKNIYIGGLHLENCSALNSFHGLDSVKILAGLHISGAIDMDTLFAWPDLDFINLRIKDNQTIKSLRGLHTVAQNREIFLENTMIKNLNGLSGDSVLFDLNLKSNPELENIDAMVNKKTIARIFIENNQKLHRIDGIGYVRQVMDLHIKDNFSLTYLPDFNDIKAINNIMIRDEPAKTNITNIPRFKGLKSAKDIILFGLHKVGNYNGFDSLEVAEKLYFQVLGSVVFEGFNRLKKAGSVVFTDGKIENINAFQNLEELSGFTVTSCGYIRKINAFGKVKKLNGLYFGYNHINFERLDCFTSLEEITKDLQMENNQKMHSVYFPKLRKIGGELYMQNNRRLNSIEGLLTLEEVGSIKLNHNDNLKSLLGLDNINHEKLKYVHLFYNDSLNLCSVKSICRYLDGKTIWHQSDKIEGNFNGCRTVEEILSNCETSQTENAGQPIIRLTNPVHETLELQIGSVGIKTMGLYTIYGGEIKAPVVSQGENHHFDVGHLRPGVYLLQYVTGNGKSGTIKWVKM